NYCGVVYGFGTAPLGGTAPPSFGYVAVGNTSSATQVTVQNTRSSGDVTISAQPTASGPFQVAGPFGDTPNRRSAGPATFPLTLHPGDSLTAGGVTFHPAKPGSASGSLMFSTSWKTYPVFSLGLSGFGEQSGFFPSASSVSFTSVPAGTTAQRQVS